MTPADRHVLYVRRIVLAIWMILLIGTPFHQYVLVPRAAIEPYGLGRLFLSSDVGQNLLVDATVLTAGRLVGICCCVLGLVLSSRRWPVIILSVVVLILDLATKSIGGYVNHAQFVPLYSLIVLSLRRPSQPGVAIPSEELLWLLSLGFIIPYTFVGASRLMEGGLAIFADQSIVVYVQTACQSRPSAICVLAGHWALIPWFASLLKIGFLAATTLELASAGVWLGRDFRIIWLILITLFHVLTWLTMNILFWENLLVMWSVLWPWRAVRVRH
jgi:hypothetical protein